MRLENSLSMLSVFSQKCGHIFIELQATQKELDEQEKRLQDLQELGKQLIDESGDDEEINKEINAQLGDFDDCWNHVAKRVIEEKEKV